MSDDLVDRIHRVQGSHMLGTPVPDADDADTQLLCTHCLISFRRGSRREEIAFSSPKSTLVGHYLRFAPTCPRNYGKDRARSQQVTLWNA